MDGQLLIFILVPSTPSWSLWG